MVNNSFYVCRISVSMNVAGYNVNNINHQQWRKWRYADVLSRVRDTCVTNDTSRLYLTAVYLNVNTTTILYNVRIIKLVCKVEGWSHHCNLSSYCPLPNTTSSGTHCCSRTQVNDACMPILYYVLKNLVYNWMESKTECRSTAINTLLILWQTEKSQFLFDVLIIKYNGRRR